MKQLALLLLSLILPVCAFCQVAENEPVKYVFYLHGAIVQQQGENAVSPSYGKYMYRAILDSFRKQGFKVISEVRPENTTGEAYAVKVATQVDSLIQNRVPPQNITIVGASAGAGIALEVAIIVENRNVNYAFMGICTASTPARYERKKICGNFFSIYESSDSPGSCSKLLYNRMCGTGFKEIKLELGNGHGFLYQPYKEWLYPLAAWINESAVAK